ncbi:hypothetical protein ACFC09_05050 [Streptomyces sp. NPDC056161]|uniref:hypothetical protein n=1 Tax=Streptomyces sp. NPDC056161 TaxID=3345732 RepID=UPI0035DB249A
MGAPQQTAKADDPSLQSTDNRDAAGEAALKAANQRAAAAVGGDPVAPANTRIPAPGNDGLGKPTSTAEHGEVIAYGPRRESGRMYIPITIHNGGDDRVAYRVKVTVVGGSQDSPVTVVTKADNVFPGTTWPTQVDITAAGTDTSPADLRISLDVVRDVYPFGDSR